MNSDYSDSEQEITDIDNECDYPEDTTVDETDLNDYLTSD